MNITDNKAFDEIIGKLPEKAAIALGRCRNSVCDKANEIVLRADKPMCIYIGGRCLFVTEEGFLTDLPRSSGLIAFTRRELEAIFLRLCDYSVYAHQDQLNSGYITIGEGVRVGICGRAVVRDSKLTNIRDIWTISFRVAREVKNCSKPLLQKLDPRCGLLLCGAPGSGKTTMIRDISRLLSYKYRVSVLDERGELSGDFRGRRGFDTGLCDVYIGYPKGTAAISALRSMSPDIIVCDELGDENDANMLLNALRCGAGFVASVHASSMQDLRRRKITFDLLNTGAFRYIAFLDDSEHKGKIGRIYELSDVSC